MLLLRTSRGVDPGIPLLRSLGSNAHVWLPGANGTTVASLPSNNYLLSAGSTGYSTVDGVDGLTLDGMGALGSELVTNGTFDTNITGWNNEVGAGTGGSVSWDTGRMAITGDGSNYSFGSQTLTTVIGRSYLVTFTISGTSVYSFGGLLPAANYPVGANQYVCVAGGTAAKIRFTPQGGVGTVYIDNISVKEYTGTHLTQPTTANKPLVRRGAYNLLKYSEQFDNAAWIKSIVVVTPNAVTDPLGGTTADLLNGVGGYCYQELTVTASTDYTASIYLYAAAPITGLRLEFVTTGFATIGATNLPNITTGWNRFTFTRNTGANTTVRLLIGGSDTLTQLLYAWGAQVEQGVVTAGDYTHTTATAASNASAGKYWWSFDGSNDSLLSGNLGITNACTIVIAGRVNAIPASAQALIGEAATGLKIYIDTSGITVIRVGTAALINVNGAISAGVPFVLTFRLSGGTAVIRVNGVQVATAATALTFAAITGARIGTDFDGVSNPLNGALGWVVPLPVALSDADCLTVERLVSSQFPNGPVF